MGAVDFVVAFTGAVDEDGKPVWRVDGDDIADRTSIGDVFPICVYEAGCWGPGGSMMLEIAGDALARKGVVCGGEALLFAGGLNGLCDDPLIGADEGPGGAGEALSMVDRMGS